MMRRFVRPILAVWCLVGTLFALHSDSANGADSIRDAVTLAYHLDRLDLQHISKTNADQWLLGEIAETQIKRPPQLPRGVRLPGKQRGSEYTIGTPIAHGMIAVRNVLRGSLEEEKIQFSLVLPEWPDAISAGPRRKDYRLLEELHTKAFASSSAGSAMIFRYTPRLGKHGELCSWFQIPKPWALHAEGAIRFIRQNIPASRTGSSDGALPKGIVRVGLSSDNPFVRAYVFGLLARREQLAEAQIEKELRSTANLLQMFQTYQCLVSMEKEEDGLGIVRLIEKELRRTSSFGHARGILLGIYAALILPNKQLEWNKTKHEYGVAPLRTFDKPEWLVTKCRSLLEGVDIHYPQL
jgi:hypothetical protein